MYTVIEGNFSGNEYQNHFIGSDEKRRNNKTFIIDFPFTTGNYRVFYAKSADILSNVCFAIESLLKGDKTPNKSGLYKILIESLLTVHHVNTKTRKSKLHGINSLSTSCLDNTFCLSRIKCNTSVCSHCYSATQQKQQLALQDRNTINGIILRNVVIPKSAWKKYFPVFDLSKYFRIESFGDVQNLNQCENYINFMNAFPKTHFAVWTKNYGIWEIAMDKNGQPKNMSYVISSNEVNKPATEIKSKYAHHIFTVYDKAYAKANNIKITCGGRACMADCIQKKKGCYFRNTERMQNEELK